MPIYLDKFTDMDFRKNLDDFLNSTEGGYVPEKVHKKINERLKELEKFKEEKLKILAEMKKDVEIKKSTSIYPLSYEISYEREIENLKSELEQKINTFRQLCTSDIKEYITKP